MPMAHSIPILPDSGVDQPAVLEAVVCAIWLTSFPGPPVPVSWGCLRLPAGSKPRAGSRRVTSSCLGVPHQGTAGG